MITDYLQSFYQTLQKAVITDCRQQLYHPDDAYNNIIMSMIELRSAKQTVFLIGNGGSCSIISHAAVDFVNSCGIKAYPFTDSSQMSCMANDYGYENVFKMPLSTMFGKKDALIAVSSSGTSPNIVNAARYCKALGGFVVTFSGFKANNPLHLVGDYNFWLDSCSYGQVEISHSLLLHILTDQLKRRFSS